MKSSLFTFAILMAASCAMAQSMRDPSSGGDMTAKSTSADALFLKKLAEGDLAEVDAGRLATQKSANKDVKDFGQEMVTDHSKNEDELKTLAASHGVHVPATIDAQHAALKTKLEKAGSSEFDSEYVAAQVRDHEKTVALLKKEIGGGGDAAVKEFAQKTLPVVEHHLAMAKELQSKTPHTVAERTHQ